MKKLTVPLTSGDIDLHWHIRTVISFCNVMGWKKNRGSGEVFYMLQESISTAKQLMEWRTVRTPIRFLLLSVSLLRGELSFFLPWWPLSPGQKVMKKSMFYSCHQSRMWGEIFQWEYLLRFLFTVVPLGQKMKKNLPNNTQIAEIKPNRHFIHSIFYHKLQYCFWTLGKLYCIPW